MYMYICLIDKNIFCIEKNIIGLKIYLSDSTCIILMILR
jgi:hypothetical protein